MTERFVCPQCGFRIFNRRVAKCEKCAAALPAELRYSEDEIAALDADHEKSAAERRAREEKERRDDDDDGAAAATITSLLT